MVSSSERRDNFRIIFSYFNGGMGDDIVACIFCSLWDFLVLKICAHYIISSSTIFCFLSVLYNERGSVTSLILPSSLMTWSSNERTWWTPLIESFIFLYFLNTLHKHLSQCVLYPKYNARRRKSIEESSSLQ